jgi:Uma2 family endonuclease
MQPITDIAQLDLNGSYTYADYLLWQFQERLELIKGHIFKMAAPSSLHQQISTHLTSLFFTYLRNKPYKVFAAPFDVRLVDFKKTTADNEVTTVVQPDICIICDPAKIDRRGCIGAPDLIVEILSRGNTRKDLNDKFEVYEQNAVREYWIVHPNDATVTVFDFDSQLKKYQLRKIYDAEEQVAIGIFDNFYVNLPDVFEGLEDW